MEYRKKKKAVINVAKKKAHMLGVKINDDSLESGSSGEEN